MKIQIDGANTLNKGSELILLFLEQIESKIPNAIVHYNSNQIGEKKLNIKSDLIIKKRWAFVKYSKYPVAILKRLNFPFTFSLQNMGLKILICY